MLKFLSVVVQFVMRTMAVDLLLPHSHLRLKRQGNSEEERIAWVGEGEGGGTKERLCPIPLRRKGRIKGLDGA